MLLNGFVVGSQPSLLMNNAAADSKHALRATRSAHTQEHFAGAREEDHLPLCAQSQREAALIADPKLLERRKFDFRNDTQNGIVRLGWNLQSVRMTLGTSTTWFGGRNVSQQRAIILSVN